MKKFISNLVGFTLTALAILPPFNDESTILGLKGVGLSHWRIEIPVIVNSFGWVYLVVLAGLLLAYFCFMRVNLLVKLLAVYVYLTCFFSAAPYISFNAMLLIVPALYLYVLIKNHTDKKIIINWIVALFWFEVVLSLLQFIGKDTLINFDRPQSVFLGSIMQHMRIGSLFAIISPFVLLKSKWYMIPLIICMFLCGSSSFALALCAAVFVYILLNKNILKKYKIWGVSIVLILAVAHSIHNHASFETAFDIGRVPAWSRIVGTGTGAHYHLSKISSRDGIKESATNIIKGRGLNIFPYLYPVLVEDPNPFAQCHNDWLQIAWELGLIGLFLSLFYYLQMIESLYFRNKKVWLCGLIIIGVNMFFAFPLYMIPSTPLLILCYFALCEKETEEGYVN